MALDDEVPTEGSDPEEVDGETGSEKPPQSAGSTDPQEPSGSDDVGQERSGSDDVGQGAGSEGPAEGSGAEGDALDGSGEQATDGSEPPADDGSGVAGGTPAVGSEETDEVPPEPGAGASADPGADVSGEPSGVAPEMVAVIGAEDLAASNAARPAVQDIEPGGQPRDGGWEPAATIATAPRTRHMRKNRWLHPDPWMVAVAVAVVLLLGGGAAGLVLATGHKAAVPPRTRSTTTTTTTAVTTTTTTEPQGKIVGGGAPMLSSMDCPLTGAPAPLYQVPHRPALAVNIGNDPEALPQSGLDHADVVFEVPVEGGITRLVAVFQCSGAPMVGPVRSGRWVDPQVLDQLDHPIAAFAGGIDPDQAAIAAAPLFDANFFTYGNLYYRVSDRVAPENLYLHTAAVWPIDHSRTPPHALFAYALKPGKGTAASKVEIPFSGAEDVVWRWDPTTRTWMRFYGSQQDVGADGTPVSASNVVIEVVPTVISPLVEDADGSHEVYPLTTGRGRAWVLRDGEAISGTWSRSSIDHPTAFTSADGHTIRLAPGPSWIEIVPEGVPVTIS